MGDNIIDSKSKVTYLLGAGASYGALPKIKNMGEAITSIMNCITTEMDKNGHGNDKNFRLAEAKHQLNVLYEACSNHLSIDTYAKMLFLTDEDQEYIKTKNLIILFFELYYYYYKKIDKRYDAFFASILSKNSPKFPNHINVIS